MSQYSGEIKIETLKSFYLSYISQQNGLTFTKNKLDFVDLQLLNILSNNSRSVKELCTISSLERKEISKRIAKLAKSGFIAKEVMDGDKRSSRIFLTEEGQEIERAGSSKINEILETATANLSMKEEKCVLKYLLDLNKTLSALN